MKKINNRDSIEKYKIFEYSTENSTKNTQIYEKLEI